MFSRLLFATTAFAAAVAHQHGPHGDHIGSPGCASLVTDYGYYCKNTDAVTARTKYLVCSTEGDEEAECPIAMQPYQRVVAISLDKVHSEAACQEGESYGLRDQAIWVKGGCTATFAAQLALDDEHCDATRDEIELQDCEATLLDMATCHDDMVNFCGDVCRNGACTHPWGFKGQWQGRRDGEGHGMHGMGHHHGGHSDMGEHGMHHDHHHPPQHPRPGRMGCSGQPPLSPVAFKLGQCFQEHMPSLSPECRQTALVETLTAPPPPPLRFDFDPDDLAVLAMAITAFFGVPLVIAGFVYFFLRRRQLDAHRLSGAVKTGRWSTGLFHCDWKSFLPSCLCPLFQNALNQAEVHDRSSSLADVAMNMSHHSLITSTYYTRQAIRAKFDMPEEPVTDCLTSIFCLPCAIAQNTRELEAHSDVADDIAAVMPVMGKVVPVKEASDMMI